MSLRSIALLVALLHTGCVLANDKSTNLVNDGQRLQAEGKGNDAYARYQEAAKADPTSSTPMSHIAYLLYVSSRAAPAKEAAGQRQHAEQAANAALALNDRDPLAMEVLRVLADGQEQKRFKPSAAAQAAIDDAEVLFKDKKFEAALTKYQLAEQIDPNFAEAVLLQGDCYFLMDDMARAEPLFRKAAQMDPLYGAAWRFLFDAQLRQGKLKDAEASAISAIAALPSERQAWLRINFLMDKWGSKLSPFSLKPRVQLKGTTIEMDADIPESDNAVWMAHGMALATASAAKGSSSAFARDLEAWDNTLAIATELRAGEKLKDDGLRAMLRFHKGGQLTAALFLLQYREAYRPDFEAWKQANPGAIKHFIDTYQVGL